MLGKSYLLPPSHAPRPNMFSRTHLPCLLMQTSGQPCAERAPALCALPRVLGAALAAHQPAGAAQSRSAGSPSGPSPLGEGLTRRGAEPAASEVGGREDGRPRRDRPSTRATGAGWGTEKLTGAGREGESHGDCIMACFTCLHIASNSPPLPFSCLPPEQVQAAQGFHWRGQFGWRFCGTICLLAV